MRDKIKKFVDDVLAQIPQELPEDEVAVEVVTRIMHDRELVPVSLGHDDAIEDICDRLTELGVTITGDRG